MDLFEASFHRVADGFFPEPVDHLIGGFERPARLGQDGNPVDGPRVSSEDGHPLVAADEHHVGNSGRFASADDEQDVARGRDGAPVHQDEDVPPRAARDRSRS